MRELNSGRRAAASGQTKSVVVFLHGYGADGNDLRGKVPSLAELEKLIGYLGICNNRHVFILLMG